jgi:hypothetical protein
MHKKLIALSLALTLNACGGGGTDEIPIPALQLNDFFADWTSTNPSCVQLGPQSSYQITGIGLWWGDYTKNYALFDNSTCTAPPVGSMADTYTVAWSAPTSALVAKGAARIKLSDPRRETLGTQPSPTIGLVTDTVFALIYTENNQLSVYLSGGSADLDAEGYPLGISSPSATYAK